MLATWLHRLSTSAPPFGFVCQSQAGSSVTAASCDTHFWTSRIRAQILDMPFTHPFPFNVHSTSSQLPCRSGSIRVADSGRSHYLYIYIYITLYIYIYILDISQDAATCLPVTRRPPSGLNWRLAGTANLRTNIMDFRGFDSSILLILRGGIILMSMGDFPESLSQAILVGIMLVGRVGVLLLSLLLLLRLLDHYY